MLASPEIRAEQLTHLDEFDQYLRTYNNATTWFAEVLDGSMRTPFEYTYRDGELYADDGSALKPIFDKAIREADSIAARNPRLVFEKRRRLHERNEYQEMLKMAQGNAPNTMVVVSDFPEELMGGEDVGGYNTTRQQTMLRVIYWQDNQMYMLSQSLDGSNRKGLEKIYESFATQPQPGELLGQRILSDLSADEQNLLIDRLMGVYDRELSRQFGGSWYAGRKEVKADTYSFVCAQNDLLDKYVHAEQRGELTDTERYNFAAALSERYRKMTEPKEAQTTYSACNVALGAIARPLSIELELVRAGLQARQDNKSFSGCGASLSRSSGSSEVQDQLSDLGYGNENAYDASEDKFGPLTFKCTQGHTNHRKRGELLTECQTKGCKKGSVGCG